jgi:hypothetical protein
MRPVSLCQTPTADTAALTQPSSRPVCQADARKEYGRNTRSCVSVSSCVKPVSKQGARCVCQVCHTPKGVTLDTRHRSEEAWEIAS